jgi:hypothetical protein
MTTTQQSNSAQEREVGGGRWWQQWMMDNDGIGACSGGTELEGRRRRNT